MVVFPLCPWSKAVMTGLQHVGQVANLSEHVHVHDVLNNGTVYLIWMVLDELDVISPICQVRVQADQLAFPASFTW